MVGVTSVEVRESLEDLAQQLRQAKTPTVKERLQLLYWLKQGNAFIISAIALAIGKHQNTLQTWLSMYRDRVNVSWQGSRSDAGSQETP